MAYFKTCSGGVSGDTINPTIIFATSATSNQTTTLEANKKYFVFINRQDTGTYNPNMLVVFFIDNFVVTKLQRDETNLSNYNCTVNTSTGVCTMSIGSTSAAGFTVVQLN